MFSLTIARRFKLSIKMQHPFLYFHIFFCWTEVQLLFLIVPFLLDHQGWLNNAGVCGYRQRWISLSWSLSQKTQCSFEYGWNNSGWKILINLWQNKSFMQYYIFPMAQEPTYYIGIYKKCEGPTSLVKTLHIIF